ncbi:zinc finger protein swm [Cotesia glomerata]|uniref:zinc finger protein swm n=1 Tax=Cotesia glomerata TaxID=32391 RepID=UPI001D0028E4|nr:zinc finger protein swm [Cotesia glomerata]
MIIENPEQFKNWLTTVLEPLCDADPAALAKYVYALVKKDKTLEELQEGMVEQLDVFLQHETKKFVDLLFKTLETQDYLLQAPQGNLTEPISSPRINPFEHSVNSEQLVEPTVTQLCSITNPALSVQTNGSTATSTLNKRESRKSESEKEDKDKRTRSRGRFRSRSKSRSRSWEKDRRRSRSREHRRDRERDRSRLWRNKSPPSTVRRHERRRSRSRSSSSLRIRVREIADSRDHRIRFRNRSPTPLRSRSRSKSTEKKNIDKTEKLVDESRLDCIETSPAGTPSQDNNHGDIDMRLSTASQSIQSVVALTSNISKNQIGEFLLKRRCRDFDEKGYCMRGDLCPYDHGTDPVVLEDVALSRVLTFGPHGSQTVGTETVPTISNSSLGQNGTGQPPHVPLANLPPPNLRNPPHSNMEYNPDAPSMEPRISWSRHSQSNVGIYGRGERELIRVPVIPHIQPPETVHSQTTSSLKRKQTFDFNRLGPKQRLNHNSANCSLELKKVPRTLNNITQLNNHFSKFGKIVNIQVNFGGDPEAALVTFQLPSEAKAAYRSTEAVLNNRFIKVFWHSNINNTAASSAIENVPPGCRPSVKERLGAAVPLSIKLDDNEYVPTRRSNDDQQENERAPQQQQQEQHPQQKQQQQQEKQVSQQKQDQEHQQQQQNKKQLLPDQQQQLQQSQEQQQQQILLLLKQEKEQEPKKQEQQLLLLLQQHQEQQPQEQQQQHQQKQSTTNFTISSQKNKTIASTREEKVYAIKKTQEILAVKETLKKKQEQKRKEVIKITADLRKRKQELLDKNLMEIRTLIEKAEKNPEQKDAIMETIKVIQQCIDQLRKDLAANGQSSGTKLLVKSREQTQKEILDAELDLMTAHQEGQDAGELQKRLNELRAQAAVLSINATKGTNKNVKSSRVVRGGHNFTCRGRGNYMHVSTDHRPTSLLISGYETEEKMEVLAHFQQFGEIVNQLVDDATPSIVLNFKSRKEAEIAMLKGRTFQDRLLSVTWISTHHLHRGGIGATLTTNPHSVVSLSSDQNPAEIMLLEEHEEEEEEDGESRSWRR